MSIIFRALYFLTVLCLTYLVAALLDQPSSWSQTRDGITSGLFTALVWCALSLYTVPARLRNDEAGKAGYRRRWGLVMGLVGGVACGILGPVAIGGAPQGQWIGWILTGSTALPLALVVLAALRKPHRLFGGLSPAGLDPDPLPDGGLAPPPGIDLAGPQGRSPRGDEP